MLDRINHMFTVGDINYFFGIASIGAQGLLAALYLVAALRHRRASFFLLLVGALSWAGYIVTAMVSTGPDLSEETATNIFRVSLLLGFLALFLTLPGIWLLLRSYRAMASQLPSPPAPPAPGLQGSGKWGPQ